MLNPLVTNQMSCEHMKSSGTATNGITNDRNDIKLLKINIEERIVFIAFFIFKICTFLCMIIGYLNS